MLSPKRNRLKAVDEPGCNAENGRPSARSSGIRAFQTRKVHHTLPGRVVLL